MGVIYPSRLSRQQPRKRRNWLRIASVCAIAFMFLNLAIAAYYHGRTYPRTSVAGVSIGNTRYGDIAKKAGTLHILPQTVTLAYGDKKTDSRLSALGIRTDPARTKASAPASRGWLPVLNLFTHHQLAAPAAIDDVKLQAAGESLIPVFHQVPANAGLTVKNAAFAVKKGTDGYDISIARLKNALLTGLDAGKHRITVPVSFKTPKYSDADAAKDAAAFNAQLKTRLTYQAGSKPVTMSAADIAGWFAPAEAGYALQDANIRASIAKKAAEAGMHASNLKDAVAKTKAALTARKALSFKLEPYTTVRTYHYCTGVKGVDEANRSALAGLLQETYGDIRGWNLDGQINLEPPGSSDGPCDFTVWLARADLMPTFGDICDPQWSCRVGANVVINFTRWQEASPAWKQYGGSLADYRHMAINHETGHWFGFEHSTCPGAGQPAPVMMQQSIELGGCTFNPWPTPRERTVLARSLDLQDPED